MPEFRAFCTHWFRAGNKSMQLNSTSSHYRTIMAEPRSRKVTIDQNALTSPLVLQSLSKILSKLKENPKITEKTKASLTEAALAQLVITFRNVMEQQCGRDAPKPKPITKLPLHGLQDYSADGPLASVLAHVLEEASRKNMSPDDLLGDKKKSTQLLESTDKMLTKTGKLVRPKIFLNKVPVGMLNKLSKMAIDHGATMVSSEEAATHVVDWNEDVDSAPDNFDDFIRILEVKGALVDPNDALPTKQSGLGGAALVHWWYYPDSYNEWISDTEINAGDTPDLAALNAPTRSKWYVCCRFILDCDVFNEWGNPVDYENENETGLEGLEAQGDQDGGLMNVDEQYKGSSASKKARGRKRFSQLSTGGQDKQPAKDLPILGALVGTEKLMPDAIPLSLRPDVNARVLEIAPAGGESKLTETGSKRKVADAQLDSDAAQGAESDTSTTSPDWFQQSAVSSFEEQVLGTTCSADPADYLKIRNGIIALCAQSPLQYITGTECRRKLPGDVSKILQVHEFLNAFALINARARREARSEPPAAVLSGVTAPKGASSAQSHKGHAGWTPQQEALLMETVTKHSASSGDVDWAAVAVVFPGQTAGSCAAHFVELDLGCSSKPAAQHTSSLLATLQDLSKISASAVQKRAIAATAQEAVAAKVQEIDQSMGLLCGKYVQAKLEVLQERLSLLEGVEGLFELERQRMDVEKKELHVLRAQLALTQQSFSAEGAAVPL